MTDEGISAWVWLLGLQLLLVLPFTGQPIHMDDSIFVDIGRNVLKTPWHAQDFTYIFEGRRVPDMGSHSHPPFVGYWIGLLLWVFGEGPRLNVTLHLGFVVFPLIFAAGMYRLARRFGVFPRLVTLVAIASPAAVVASHTVMTDYPCLAFSTLGLALYVEGADDRRPFKLWISGILLVLASFCSYPAVIVTGLCWLYALLKQCKLRAALWAPFLTPVWMAAWLTYSSLHFGRFVLGATTHYLAQAGGLSAAGLTHKLLTLPIFLAGTLVLPLPLIRAALGWWRGRAAILWAVMSAGLAQIYASGYALPDRFLVACFLAVGGWIIVGLLLRMKESCLEGPSTESRQDAVFLSLWAGAMSAQVILAYSSMTARYLLPLLPPVVLLAFFKSSHVSLNYLRRAAVLCLSIGLVLGISLSAADFEMARVHREIPRYLGTVFAGWEQQTRFGAEWGLRHYMLEQGFRQFLSAGDDFTGGQFVLSPRAAVPYSLPQDVDSMLVPVRRWSWQSSLPLRLMNREAHAGFYSSSWGLLPFAISRAPVEEITVRQVSYLTEKLPEITLEKAAEEEAILPVPAPGGGVDIVVPVPSRVSIPYDIPLPVRVQFSCVAMAATGGCPMRVLYDHDGVQSEVALQRRNDPADAESLSFELPGVRAGMIVLDTTSRVTIRNWVMLPVMLPSGGAP